MVFQKIRVLQKDSAVNDHRKTTKKLVDAENCGN